LPGRDDDGADTRISGSSAITSARVADRDVTITGPAEVEVGIPATFVATLDRGLSAHWVLPDGATLPAGEGVVYTADSAGEFTVTLLVVAPGSPPRIVAHSARARP
jgi:hypothetical protein